MAKRLNDLRSDLRTTDDARRLFAAIAHLELRLAAADARAEQRIAKIKEDHHNATVMDRTILEHKAGLLTRFIESHKHLFQKPRKIRTEFGTFGLQKVNEIVIKNPDAAIKWLEANGEAGAVKRSSTPIKAAVKTLFSAGKRVGGCFRHTGDTSVYTVEKALLNGARSNPEILVD